MLYTKTDIETLQKKSDDIKNELEKLKATLCEPSFSDLKKAHNIVLDFCREKKRKIYGSTALNLLLINKNPEDKLYKDDKFSDIDIYSPEPLNDLVAICNILHKNNFKQILGQEAQHSETYTVKYYNETLCDLSYVARKIYNKMPSMEFDKLHVIGPNFMVIDYLRIFSNPIDSYWRFFECGNDLKAFTRFIKLQNAYPLPYYDGPLPETKLKKNVSAAIETVYNFVLNHKKTTITIGFYVYNYFLITTGYNNTTIPFFEFISVDYKNDVLDLLKVLKDQFPEIEHKEFYPWFQYSDYSVEIYLENDIVCRVYNHNKKCIPYQDVPAYNFMGSKPVKINSEIRIGSSTIVMLNFLVDAQKMRANGDSNGEKYYYNVLSHCMQMRTQYFKKYNKTFVDDSIFKEFVVNCIGNEVTAEAAMRIRIEKRKLQKKPLVHRYNPSDKFQEEAPNYIFNNSSGNIVNNPKNLRLVDNASEDYEEQCVEDECSKNCIETNSE